MNALVSLQTMQTKILEYGLDPAVDYELYFRVDNDDSYVGRTTFNLNSLLKTAKLAHAVKSLEAQEIAVKYHPEWAGADEFYTDTDRMEIGSPVNPDHGLDRCTIQFCSIEAETPDHYTSDVIDLGNFFEGVETMVKEGRTSMYFSDSHDPELLKDATEEFHRESGGRDTPRIWVHK